MKHAHETPYDIRVFTEQRGASAKPVVWEQVSGWNSPDRPSRQDAKTIVGINAVTATFQFYHESRMKSSRSLENGIEFLNSCFYRTKPSKPRKKRSVFLTYLRVAQIAYLIGVGQTIVITRWFR